VQRAFGDFVDRACHHDRKAIANFDADLSAWHMHGDFAVDEPELVGNGGRRARTAARRERVPGAALPDLDLDIFSIKDF